MITATSCWTKVYITQKSTMETTSKSKAQSLTASFPAPLLDPACALRILGNNDLSKPCSQSTTRIRHPIACSLPKLCNKGSRFQNRSLKHSVLWPSFLHIIWGGLQLITEKNCTLAIWWPATSLSITSTRLRRIAPVSTAVSLTYSQTVHEFGIELKRLLKKIP